MSLLAEVVAGASDMSTVVAGVLATAITALNAVQTSQMSGMRTDLQKFSAELRAHSEEQERRHQEHVTRQRTLEGRAGALESRVDLIETTLDAPQRPRSRRGRTPP